MFTIILIVVLIVLLALMTGLNFTNVRRCEMQYENSKFWYLKYMESEDNYKALEQGRDEESEAYEQQYLSFMETIENQSTAIDSYIEDLLFLVRLVEKHYDECLPDLGDAAHDQFSKIRTQILLQEG